MIALGAAFVGGTGRCAGPVAVCPPRGRMFAGLDAGRDWVAGVSGDDRRAALVAELEAAGALVQAFTVGAFPGGEVAGVDALAVAYWVGFRLAVVEALRMVAA